MSVASIGAACFGLVVGWIAYRTLRRKEGNVGLSDLSTVIGVIGGGAITTLFKEPGLFGSYAIGLAIGFFAYFVVALILEGRKGTVTWMGGKK
jgi:hypothetical protein